MSERRWVPRPRRILDTTHHEEPNQARTHPEAPPQDVNHGDQRVSRGVTEQTGNKLAETTPEGDKGKEDRGRVQAPPPLSDVRRRNPSRAREARQTQRCGWRNGAQEDGDVGIFVYHLLELPTVLLLNRHFLRIAKRVVFVEVAAV